MSKGALTGLRILVVEDQFLIADEMARSIRTLGGEPLGPCPSVAAARLQIARQKPDLALLDVNLKGEDVFALAADLSDLDVPFAFATGYESWMIPAALQDRPRLEKPVSPTALQDIIAALKLRRR